MRGGSGGGGEDATLFLKPLPYHHQNLRFLLHYLRPNQKFKIILMTGAVCTVALSKGFC